MFEWSYMYRHPFNITVDYSEVALNFKQKELLLAIAQAKNFPKALQMLLH